MASDSQLSGPDRVEPPGDAAPGNLDAEARPPAATEGDGPPSADKKPAPQQAADQPAADKQPASKQPSANKQPAAGKKSLNKRTADKPTAEKRTGDKSAGGQPKPDNGAAADRKAAGKRKAAPPQAGGKAPDGKRADGKQTDGKQTDGKQTGKKRRRRAPESSQPAAVAVAAAGGDDNSSGNDEPEDDEQSLMRALHHRFLLFNAVPSWLVSMLVHAALLMILAIITLPEKNLDQQITAVANPEQLVNVEEEQLDVIDPVDVQAFESSAADTPDVAAEAPEIVPDMSLAEMEPAPEKFKLDLFGDDFAPRDDLMDRMGGGTGEGLKGVRSAKGKADMLKKYGGTKGSEAAVAAALQWLANHQMRDGGWDFDHQKGPCAGRCKNPGLIPPSRNGATAMALLPFLGAGQTHQEGKYKKTVEAGLAYLIRNMKVRTGMGDLTDKGGRMYSHGLASITLCEAYAMTNDHGLLQPAQLSLNYIIYAQDPVGGGWRYAPRQAGDTSVVGWQLMALKSGHMAYLRVPPATIRGATKFLNFVQDDGGASYGYTVPGKGQATSAVGLLCRMYLGWNHDEPALKRGVARLAKMGPSNNLYFDYYASQVMRHFGGESWDKWNTVMRDRLVKTQDKKGHAAGSWFVAKGGHADRGGRLYCTSMSTMILEVYYRHMPIYGTQAAEEDFPL